MRETIIFTFSRPFWVPDWNQESSKSTLDDAGSSSYRFRKQLASPSGDRVGPLGKTFSRLEFHSRLNSVETANGHSFFLVELARSNSIFASSLQFRVCALFVFFSGYSNRETRRACPTKFFEPYRSVKAPSCLGLHLILLYATHPHGYE